jgi:hypothetical protein
MKSLVLKKAISKKKLACKLLNIKKNNFCLRGDLIENEILKSFTNMSNKYKLNLKKPDQSVYPSEKTISLDSVKAKYYDVAKENDTDQMIKAIFQDDVLRKSEDRENETLLLFIKNCKKYNYEEYLKSPSYFQNREIRNFITNTSLLETLHKNSSPFSLQSEFEMKLKVQSLYKLRKGEKGEKMDSITEKEFELDYYRHLNYLAETSYYEKQTKLKNVRSHNQKVMEEYRKADTILEDETEIRDEVWKNHYLQYLRQMKKAERKESLGVSKYEESFYDEYLKDNADKIYRDSEKEFSTREHDNDLNMIKELFKTKSDTNNNDQNSSKLGERVEEMEGFHYNTHASFINDGTIEPFPFYGKDDYPIEEFFDETYNLPGQDIIFAPIRDKTIPHPLPPKMSDWLDKFFIDSHLWSIFTHVQFFRLYYDKINSLTMSFFNETKMLQIKTFEDFHDIPRPANIIDYYNLLPKWARDHPSLKMVIRGLEFHQPWTSYREKMMAVNWTLQILIKKDHHFNELIASIDDNFPENITSESIASVMEIDEEESRKIVINDMDDWTDDAEMEIFGTAEEIRQIEKEEEEERKQKKKEEGRAKREAEEQKAMAAEGKVDKGAEEKKKKEAEEKKRKEAEAAANGEEPPQEQEEEEEEETEETQNRDDEKNLEARMFAPTKKSKSQEEREDEILDILDNLQGKIQVEKTGIIENDDEDIENEDGDEEEEILSEQEKKEVQELQAKHKANFENQKENMTFDEEIEQLRKISREQKLSKENKVQKLANVLEDLKNTKTTKVLEEKVKLLKKNLEETSEKLETIIDLHKKNIIKETNMEIVIYPISILKSNQLSEEFKLVIRKYFEKYINIYDEKTKETLVINLDAEESNKEDTMMELMDKISAFENENIDSSEGFDIQTDYKDSLKEDEIVVDDEDDTMLNDAYYKPETPANFVERTEDQIPFDYFINDDGFWDKYIARQRRKIDVKQFTYKPFNPYKNNIKKQLI